MATVAFEEAPQTGASNGWFAGRLARDRGCVVIAEVAQAHDGSLGLAHAYIDAVAAAGVEVVKFQTHIAAAESTPAEPWRVRFSPQDDTRFGYWQRMEFTEDQWRGLREHESHAQPRAPPSTTPHGTS